MQYQELPLFPSLVMLFKSENNFEKEFEYIKNIKYRDKISINKYLLYEPELENLKKFFQDAIKFYLQEKFKSDQNLGIAQSWATIINKGESFSPHDHPNSVINGCFYFSVDSSTPPLTLMKNQQANLYPYISDNSEYNMGTFDIHAGPGQLVLFPNTLFHKVGKSKSDLTRRSVAFNTFMIDTLGDRERMTEIDLEKIKRNN